MARYLLDTNVISERTSPKPNPSVLSKLDQHTGQCALPSPAWHELLHGCARLPQGLRRAEIELFLRDVIEPLFPILPYDHVAAQWHAQERARLDGLGRPPPFIDGQIAAIAYANNLVLVTANTKDLTRFRGINVVDWSKPTRRRR